MFYNEYVTKFIDLSGQRFSKLLVLHRVESNDGNTRFLARCDCGSEVVVRSGSLRSGDSNSCGCNLVEARKRKAIDMTGQVFGRLTVIGRFGSSPQGALWSCLCTCGKTSVVAGKVLRSGNSKSCGCANDEYRQRFLSQEYVGKVYGRLTVVAPSGTNGKKTLWLCRCSCGNEKVMSASDVKAGRVISCGCGVSNREGLLPKKVRDASAAACARRRAKKRDASGDYTPEQITDLYLKQRGCCANCGTKLGDKFHRDHKVALSAGGTNDISNIELLCAPCNLKKSKKDAIKWAKENGRLL